MLKISLHRSLKYSLIHPAGNCCYNIIDKTKLEVRDFFTPSRRYKSFGHTRNTPHVYTRCKFEYRMKYFP